MLVSIGPLRRVTYATVTTAFVLGALIVVPVQLAPQLGLDAAAGAALVTAFGLGDLTGSLLLTLRPLRGEPEALTVRWVAVMALALAGGDAAPTFPVALVAFFLVGATNAPFFVATLAARTTFAPPGGAARVFVGVAAVKVAAELRGHRGGRAGQRAGPAGGPAGRRGPGRRGGRGCPAGAPAEPPPRAREPVGLARGR